MPSHFELPDHDGIDSENKVTVTGQSGDSVLPGHCGPKRFLTAKMAETGSHRLRSQPPNTKVIIAPSYWVMPNPCQLIPWHWHRKAWTVTLNSFMQPFNFLKFELQMFQLNWQVGWFWLTIVHCCSLTHLTLFTDRPGLFSHDTQETFSILQSHSGKPSVQQAWKIKFYWWILSDYRDWASY